MKEMVKEMKTMTKLTPNVTASQAATMTAAELKAHDLAWLESRLAHARETGEGYPVETLERWLKTARAG